MLGSAARVEREEEAGEEKAHRHVRELLEIKRRGASEKLTFLKIALAFSRKVWINISTTVCVNSEHFNTSTFNFSIIIFL